jgi:hypothetical protein
MNQRIMASPNPISKGDPTGRPFFLLRDWGWGFGGGGKGTYEKALCPLPQHLIF